MHEYEIANFQVLSMHDAIQIFKISGGDNVFIRISLVGLITGEDVIVALMLMVYMFPEARSKADSSRVIYFTKVHVYAFPSC